jgi:hypothetical protein
MKTFLKQKQQLVLSEIVHTLANTTLYEQAIAHSQSGALASGFLQIRE